MLRRELPKKNHPNVAFLSPDYHNSFTLADEFRRRGWRTRVLIPAGYPANLLFSSEHTRLLYSKKIPNPPAILSTVITFAKLWLALVRVDLVIQYGRFPQSAIDRAVARVLRLGPDYVLILSFFKKLFGLRLVYVPSGCRDSDTKENFQKLDGGRVCSSCGFADRCDDEENIRNLAIVRRYADLCITVDWYFTEHLDTKMIRYKAIYINLFTPNLVIPTRLQLPPSNAVRILHSSALGKARTGRDKNIKGTPFVVDALKQLQEEGLSVELIQVSQVPARDMRYLQTQADIVIDQLLYGSWGSTTIEALALGKPTICYLRHSWREIFSRQFPEYLEIPIISSTPESLIDDLRMLVIDEDLRRELSVKARDFALAHFDPKRAVDEILENVQSERSNFTEGFS